jgi:hypothetical protein
MLSFPIPNPEDRSQKQVKWNDCFTALPLVLSILFSQVPYLTLAVLYAPAIQYVFPASNGHRFQLLSVVVAILSSILASVIKCVLVNSYWRLLNKQPSTPVNLVPKTVGKVWMLHYTFQLSVMCAALLFVWPGLLLALRASLALPILLVERRSVLGAFNESLRLTQGKMGILISAFIAPVMVLTLPTIAVFFCMVFIDQKFFSTASAYSWTWLASHAGTIICLSSMAILSAAVTLSLVATQVRLYFYLKSMETGVPSIEPAKEGL